MPYVQKIFLASCMAWLPLVAMQTKVLPKSQEQLPAGQAAIQPTSTDLIHTHNIQAKSSTPDRLAMVEEKITELNQRIKGSTDKNQMEANQLKLSQLLGLRLQLLVEDKKIKINDLELAIYAFSGYSGHNPKKDFKHFFRMLIIRLENDTYKWTYKPDVKPWDNIDPAILLNIRDDFHPSLFGEIEQMVHEIEKLNEQIKRAKDNVFGTL